MEKYPSNLSVLNTILLCDINIKWIICHEGEEKGRRFWGGNLVVIVKLRGESWSAEHNRNGENTVSCRSS